MIDTQWADIADCPRDVDFSGGRQVLYPDIVGVKFAGLLIE
jgi:hypothetical protein